MSGKKLTNQTYVENKTSKLTNIKSKNFKIAISEPLDNNFCFKSLKKPENIRKFQAFIDETIGKKLTISEVDKMYLRTKGEIKQEINGREVVHYGKDRNPFRIFGYYNNDGYLIVTRIDPTHATHK